MPDANQAVQADHPPSRRQTDRITRLLEWRPASGNSALVGKASIRFSGGWIVSNVPVFRRADGSLSAGPPDAPLVGADGQQLTDENGKKRYTKIISFETQDARARWNEAVLAAVAEAGIQ
jgi:hypothetical protein